MYKLELYYYCKLLFLADFPPKSWTVFAYIIYGYRQYVIHNALFENLSDDAIVVTKFSTIFPSI